MDNQRNFDISELNNFLQYLGFKSSSLEKSPCPESTKDPYNIEIEIKCTKSQRKYTLTKSLANCSCHIESQIHVEENSNNNCQQALSTDISTKPLTLSPSNNNIIMELVQSAINISKGGTLSENLKNKFAIRHKSLESLKCEPSQGSPKNLSRCSTWEGPSPPRRSSSPIPEISLTSGLNSQVEEKQKLMDIFKAIIKKGEEGCDLLLNNNNTYTKKRISDIKPNENSKINMGTFVNVTPEPISCARNSTITYKRPLLTPKSSKIALLKKNAKTTTPSTPKPIKTARPDTPFKTKNVNVNVNSPSGVSKIKVFNKIPVLGSNIRKQN